MKILFIPLDERPCNLNYPKMQAGEYTKLLFPPKEILPTKKTPGNIEALWEFIEENAPTCDGVIAAIETLVYGGLLPSRLHGLTIQECLPSIERLRGLKLKNPRLTLYCSCLIMRSPAYNSSEEEPDYYQNYGEMLFSIGKYQDKKNRAGLSEEEESLLKSASETVPPDVLADYTARRAVNLSVLQECVSLVKNSSIDFLLIPQDDTAPYSFAATDQKIIFNQIDSDELWEKVQSYPGADESGCALLARMVNHLSKRTPQVYVYYASCEGAFFVPKYEDRPFGESIKAHLTVQGARLALSAKEADYFLFVNIPGATMCEAWQQREKDLTYSTHRNLTEFVNQIRSALSRGIPCILADAAFSNGGDIQLVSMLAQDGSLSKLTSYAGWNTACNTLGTALSAAFCLYGYREKQHKYLQLRIIEDLLYQSIVRQSVAEYFMPPIGASYFNMNGRQTEVEEEIKRQLTDLWYAKYQHCFDRRVFIESCKLTWGRLFEVDLELA